MPALLLAGHDLGAGDARMIVDAHVHVLPTHAAGIALPSAVASDAVADLVELAELFDVDVDQFARTLALRVLSLLSPRRLKIRLTVAGEMASWLAICVPV